MKVWARDPDRVRRGILPVVTATAVLRESAVGTWAMTLDGGDPFTEQFNPGWGVIVMDDDNTVLFSGPATSIKVSPEEDSLNVDISGVTDVQVLADKLVYPNPAEDADAQTSAYWTRTGNYVSMDLVTALVNRNAGTEALPYRQTPGLARMGYSDADPSLPRGSVNARFTNLLTEVQALVHQSGHVIDVIQRTGTTLEVVYREGVDRHRAVRFMPGGGLLDYEMTLSAPKASVVLVAGQGEGAARNILEFESEAAWGRRVEQFQDRRDTDAADELEKAARETLDEAGATASATITVEETPRLRFGHEYHLGDKVTVAMRGHEITNGVRVAEISWDEFNRTVKLTVGDYSADDPATSADTNKILKAQKAIRHLEVTQ